MGSRTVWPVTGSIWALRLRSLLELANPDYWDPVTALDWSAVWTFSAGGGLIILGALGIVALAPRWFQQVTPAPATDIRRWRRGRVRR